MARSITKKEDLLDDLRIAQALLRDAQLAADPAQQARLIELEREKIAAAEARIAEITVLGKKAHAAIHELEKDVRRRQHTLQEHINAPKIKELEALVKQLAAHGMQAVPL